MKKMSIELHPLPLAGEEDPTKHEARLLTPLLLLLPLRYPLAYSKTAGRDATCRVVLGKTVNCSCLIDYVLDQL